jgi:hypothetical protein
VVGGGWGVCVCVWGGGWGWVGGGGAPPTLGLPCGPGLFVPLCGSCGSVVCVALFSPCAGHVGLLFPLAPACGSVPSSATLQQCLQHLHTHSSNGVAVVDSVGAVVGNVSMSDVRDLVDEALSPDTVEGFLTGPVTEVGS